MNNDKYVEYLGDLGTGDSHRLEENVMLNKRAEGLAITFYDTDIITFTPDGQVILKCNGYYTRSTCKKFNQYLTDGWYVRSKKGEWIVTRGETTIPFEEGMTIAL